MKKLEFETIKSRFLLIDSEDAPSSFNIYLRDIEEKLGVQLTTGYKLSEITEEEASEIVDNKPSIIYDDGSISLHYRNYLYHDIQASHIWKSSAIGSLHSLFQSKGIHLFENPLKNTLSIQSLEGSQKHSQQIKEAEQKTFYNPYIFKL